MRLIEIDSLCVVIDFEPQITKLISYFGNGGVVTTDFGGQNEMDSDIVFDIKIQQDGQIVAAGSSSSETGSDFAVARYNSDGSVDTTFGIDGMVITDMGEIGDSTSTLSLQADGKLIVAGWSYDPAFSGNHIVLVRYNINGSLDTTFDGDGIVTSDLAGGGRGWLCFGSPIRRPHPCSRRTVERERLGLPLSAL